MPGLDPGIQVFLACWAKAWMAGMNPAITQNVWNRQCP
jgi:hypothetical protein